MKSPETSDPDLGVELNWLREFLARDASTQIWTHDDSKSSSDLSARMEQLRAIIECLDEDRSAETFDVSSDGEPLASHDVDILRGRRLGHFEVEKLLGVGGCGIVLQAIDIRLGRRVALKIPRPDILMNERVRQAFLAEAGTLASLKHPYLATIYEAGNCGPIYYMATELCGGPTLAEWLRCQTEPVPPRLAVELTVMLCEVLQYIHHAGILHRDIKPSNILLQPLTDSFPDGPWSSISTFGYWPRLTDFGLAYYFEGEQEVSNPVAGTPSYMAAEQARGDGSKIGVATDIYGLGAVLYHLLVGRPPFCGRDDDETRRLVIDGQLIAPRVIRPSLPIELEAICQRSLSVDGRDRYRSAEELRAELQRYLRGEPIHTLQYGVLHRFAKRCQRHPAISSLLAALAITVGIATACLWTLYRFAESERRQAMANFHRAIATVDKLEAIAHSSQSNVPGGGVLRREFDRTSLAFYEDFAANQNASSPELTRSLGRTYHHIGSIHLADGDTSAARQSFVKSLELLKSLVKDQDNDVDEVNDVLAAQYSLARLELECGNDQVGLELLHDVVDRRIQLARDNSGNSTLRHQAADSLCAVGFYHVSQSNYEHANPYLMEAERELLILREQTPDNLQVLLSLAIVKNRIGISLGFDGKVSAAIPFHLEAVEQLKKLIDAQPANNSHRRELGSAHYYLARCYKDKQKALAEFHYQESLAIRRWLVSANSNVPEYADDLADTLRGFGTFLGYRKRLEESRTMLVEARDILLTLVETAPEITKYSYRLAECEKRIAQFGR